MRTMGQRRGEIVGSVVVVALVLCVLPGDARILRIGNSGFEIPDSAWQSIPEEELRQHETKFGIRRDPVEKDTKPSTTDSREDEESRRSSIEAIEEEDDSVENVEFEDDISEAEVDEDLVSELPESSASAPSSSETREETEHMGMSDESELLEEWDSEFSADPVPYRAAEWSILEGEIEELERSLEGADSLEELDGRDEDVSFVKIESGVDVDDPLQAIWLNGVLRKIELKTREERRLSSRSERNILQDTLQCDCCAMENCSASCVGTLEVIAYRWRSFLSTGECENPSYVEDVNMQNQSDVSVPEKDIEGPPSQSGQPDEEFDASSEDETTLELRNVYNETLSIPLAHRINYASKSCGARVVGGTPQAENLGHVVSVSSHEYALLPCRAEKWVTIKLCEDVLVDTIVMANMEFFSSNFKEVAFAGGLGSDETEWGVVGSFRANNSRTSQKFVLNEMPVWMRYLRVRIAEHYGKEHYCPLSYVQVFGSTLSEDFKQRMELQAKKSTRQSPGNNADPPWDHFVRNRMRSEGSDVGREHQRSGRQSAPRSALARLEPVVDTYWEDLDDSLEAEDNENPFVALSNRVNRLDHLLKSYRRVLDELSGHLQETARQMDSQLLSFDVDLTAFSVTFQSDLMKQAKQWKSHARVMGSRMQQLEIQVNRTISLARELEGRSYLSVPSHWAVMGGTIVASVGISLSTVVIGFLGVFWWRQQRGLAWKGHRVPGTPSSFSVPRRGHRHAMSLDGGMFGGSSSIKAAMEAEPVHQCTSKVFIPYKEYPDRDFVSFVLGPFGRTLRKLENETQCRMEIRGQKFEDVGRRGGGSAGHTDARDDLHVLISADTNEGLQNGTDRIESLLAMLISNKRGDLSPMSLPSPPRTRDDHLRHDSAVNEVEDWNDMMTPAASRNPGPFCPISLPPSPTLGPWEGPQVSPSMLHDRNHTVTDLLDALQSSHLLNEAP